MRAIFFATCRSPLDLSIQHTDPVCRRPATGGTKPATLETGAEILWSRCS